MSRSGQGRTTRANYLDSANSTCYLMGSDAGAAASLGLADLQAVIIPEPAAAPQRY